MLRLRAESPLATSEQRTEKTAVIMVWLPGGCSHLDTYDPKPDIGTENVGRFGSPITENG